MFICFYVLTNSLKSMTNKPSTLNWWKLEDHNICKTNSRNLGARYGFFSLTKFFLSGVFYQNLTVSNKKTLFWLLTFQSLCLWKFIFYRFNLICGKRETQKHINISFSVPVFVKVDLIPTDTQTGISILRALQLSSELKNTLFW